MQKNTGKTEKRKPASKIRGKKRPQTPGSRIKCRRTNAEIEDDNKALQKALQKQIKEAIPNVPAMRHDKPYAALSIAYSPMSEPASTTTHGKTYQIASAAGALPKNPNQAKKAQTNASELFLEIQRLSPFAPDRAAVFLSILADGGKHSEAMAKSGLCQIDIAHFMRADDAFKACYDYAKSLQLNNIGAKVLEAAVERAVDGVDDPIVGRIAPSQDAIIGYRKKYSDRLAERLLSGADKRFRDDKMATPAGPSIQYNIQINQSEGSASPAVFIDGGNVTEKEERITQVVDIEQLNID